MKQIKAHIAVSLDGHTATLDKELDWLPREIKNTVGKQYLEADCLLMGTNTYNYIFEHQYVFVGQIEYGRPQKD